MKSAKPGTVPATGMISDQSMPVERLFSSADEYSEWHTKALRAWLLALLRLAVTRDRADRLEVMATARALARLGASPTDTQAVNSQALDDQVLNKPMFHFFCATSTELCRAIADPKQPGHGDVLRRHILRIEDLRLKRAFTAAVAIESSAPQPSAPRSTLTSFESGLRSARHR